MLGDDGLGAAKVAAEVSEGSEAVGGVLGELGGGKAGGGNGGCVTLEGAIELLAAVGNVSREAQPDTPPVGGPMPPHFGAT